MRPHFPVRGITLRAPTPPIPFAFVPHTNRIDLTRRAVTALAPWRKRLVIVDNTRSNEARELASLVSHVVHMPHRLTFTQVQNWALGVAYRIEAPYYAFCHNDADPAADTPGQLEQFVQQAQQGHLVAGRPDITIASRPWAVVLTNYDALCVYRTAALVEVGGWDENFKQYLADVDMYRRLRLAGHAFIETPCVVGHVPSQTIKADPVLRFQHENLNGHLVDYYTRKWGGSPGRERYSKPWDGALP